MGREQNLSECDSAVIDGDWLGTCDIYIPHRLSVAWSQFINNVRRAVYVLPRSATLDSFKSTIPLRSGPTEPRSKRDGVSSRSSRERPQPWRESWYFFVYIVACVVLGALPVQHIAECCCVSVVVPLSSPLLCFSLNVVACAVLRALPYRWVLCRCCIVPS